MAHSHHRLVVSCFSIILLHAPILALGDDWPQWRGPQRDGVWRETGIVDRLPQPEIPLVWRVPISGGYSGPTVAEGLVYVSDRVTEPEEAERIHCFAWDTGEKVWTHSYPCKYSGLAYPDGPRASVTVADGRAYSLGAVGHLLCLDARTGERLWSHDLRSEYKIRLPTWGLAGAPLVEADRVIVQIGGADGACIVAFDCKTGEERWRALNDPASYTALIAITQAGRRVIVCWTEARLAGLDVDTGQVLWDCPFPTGCAIPTPVVHGSRLFISAFWEGSAMISLGQNAPTAQIVWQRRGQNERNTDALHCCMSTPVFEGDAIYGVDSYGQLRGLDADTGDRLWENTTAVPQDRWANAHLVRQADRTWLFNERGELIIARLTRAGYEELSRSKLIRPTLGQLNSRGGVCWSHPAFAYGHIFARNDEELVCADLRAR